MIKKMMPVNAMKKQPFIKNMEEIMEIDTHHQGYTGPGNVKKLQEIAR